MRKDISISQKEIENRIFVFRDTQVMIDRDLAEMYQVETRVLNQAVKRNIQRFPEEFRFQLSESEFENWKSQIVMSNEDKMGLRRPPYAFTEQGVAMLSAVLRSDIAIQVSIQIINTFVAKRKLIANHSGLLQRMEGIERKQLETDQKFEKIFKALESKNLIDNYIDESTLTHLSKKTKAVKALLLTKKVTKQVTLDVHKANEQYGHFEVKPFRKSHDRFLIIDGQDVYHLGASLKDLGSNWFAFSKMDKSSVESLLNEIVLSHT